MPSRKQSRTNTYSISQVEAWNCFHSIQYSTHFALANIHAHCADEFSHQWWKFNFNISIGVFQFSAPEIIYTYVSQRNIYIESSRWLRIHINSHCIGINIFWPRSYDDSFRRDGIANWFSIRTMKKYHVFSIPVLVFTCSCVDGWFPSSFSLSFSSFCSL